MTQDTDYSQMHATMVRNSMLGGIRQLYPTLVHEGALEAIVKAMKAGSHEKAERIVERFVVRYQRRLEAVIGAGRTRAKKVTRVEPGTYVSEDMRVQFRRVVSRQTGRADEVCWQVTVDGQAHSAWDTLRDAKQYARSKGLL